jgi:hypothetical protein
MQEAPPASEPLSLSRPMFVYHYVPNKMNGSVLYPLNELKALMPQVYAAQAAKYQVRGEAGSDAKARAGSGLRLERCPALFAYPPAEGRRWDQKLGGGPQGRRGF